MLEMRISPAFKAKEIVDNVIQKEWFEFQSRAFDLGANILSYMQTFINANRRRGGGTGNLAKAITLETSTSAGQIFWGIGNLNKLLAEAPYYYVVNYGKKVTGEAFIPGGGKAVPGYFGGGNPPNPNMKGRGTESFTYDSKAFIMKPGVIRPMSYIQASRAKMNLELRRLMTRLKRFKL